jgi:aspartate aminotransferase-like enzyme
MIPERLLLGPGPSPVSARVMRAMAQPVLSHLDPEMMAVLDDVRRRLGRIWRVGLMGAGSTLSNVLLFLTALERTLRSAGRRMPAARAAVSAAEAAAR